MKPDVWPGMSRKFFNAVKEYLGTIAPMLSLRDWTIKLNKEPADDEDVLAHCHVTDGRRHIQIWLSKDFASEDPSVIRQTLVHELLHAHLDVFMATAQKTLRNPLGQVTYSVVEAVIRRDTELVVDTLADAVASLLPEFVPPTGGTSSAS